MSDHCNIWRICVFTTINERLILEFYIKFDILIQNTCYRCQSKCGTELSMQPTFFNSFYAVFLFCDRLKTYIHQCLFKEITKLCSLGHQEHCQCWNFNCAEITVTGSKKIHIAVPLWSRKLAFTTNITGTHFEIVVFFYFVVLVCFDHSDFCLWLYWVNCNAGW